MKINIEAEAERIARKVLKVEGHEYDACVDAWKQGYGVRPDVLKWGTAMDAAKAVFEELTPKKREPAS